MSSKSRKWPLGDPDFGPDADATVYVVETFKDMVNIVTLENFPDFARDIAMMLSFVAVIKKVQSEAAEHLDKFMWANDHKHYLYIGTVGDDESKIMYRLEPSPQGMVIKSQKNHPLLVDES